MISRQSSLAMEDRRRNGGSHLLVEDTFGIVCAYLERANLAAACATCKHWNEMVGRLEYWMDLLHVKARRTGAEHSKKGSCGWRFNAQYGSLRAAYAYFCRAISQRVFAPQVPPAVESIDFRGSGKHAREAVRAFSRTNGWTLLGVHLSEKEMKHFSRADTKHLLSESQLEEVHLNHCHLQPDAFHLMAKGIRTAKKLSKRAPKSPQASPHADSPRPAESDGVSAAGGDAEPKQIYLQVLSVGFNNGGDAGVLEVLDALPGTPLSQLDVSANNCTEAALARVPELLPKSQLASLTMDSNKIRCDGAALLAQALPLTPTLRVLSLAGNAIGEVGGTALAEALAQCGLEKLLLPWNAVGPQGAVAIAMSLKANDSLRELDLSGNHIGDDGADAFAEVLHSNASLTLLDVTCNRITTTKLPKVAASSKSLDVLRIGLNRIDGLSSVVGSLTKGSGAKIVTDEAV